uniref:Uncharacterized protein n=1 Tax=Anguilla anguilla TaxID=7936 RepID=A0A0E9WBW0_ANGAN
MIWYGQHLNAIYEQKIEKVGVVVSNYLPVSSTWVILDLLAIPFQLH